MYQYKAKITKVYDADTLTVDIDLGFQFWWKGQSIRLYGINAFEVKGPEKPQGIIARDAVKALIAGYETVTITTFKDEKEKYGRWLAVVTLADGIVLNDWLVENGHAIVNTYGN